MVAISFSPYGHKYVNGIGVIEKTYLVSRQALHDQKDAVFARLEAIRRGEFEDYWDPESGEPSLSDKLDFELGQIEGARQSLCQAVLVMLYHFWEKEVLGRAGNLRGNDRHKSYVEYCSNLNPQVDEDHLEQLRCLSNVVKHGQGEGDWKNKLYKRNASLFSKTANTINLLDDLELSHDYVLKTFRAVKKSGPNVVSNFAPSQGKTLDMIS